MTKKSDTDFMFIALEGIVMAYDFVVLMTNADVKVNKWNKWRNVVWRWRIIWD